MEPLLETVDLDLDESNELKFKIKMEGNVSSPAKVRLVCEDEDFAYVFKGYGTSEMDVVQFNLPRMENKIKEGTYNARVEVLVENRYFAPLQFQINFKKSISVVAEAVRVTPKAHVETIKVTASPIAATKPVVNQVKFEQKPRVDEEVAKPAVEKNENFDDKVRVLRERFNKKLQGIRIEEQPKSSLRDAYLSKKKK